MTLTTCIFDAYGTLFDVTAAAKECAFEPGRLKLKSCWKNLANDWRSKQLQYSWIHTITNSYVSFWEITQNSLDFALEANNLEGDKELRERLLSLYWTLKAYPEVLTVLKNLQLANIEIAILSNGSKDMLNAAAKSAKIDHLLGGILSVDLIKTFSLILGYTIWYSKILIVKSLKFYLFLQMGGTLQQQPDLASMLPGLTAIMIQLINCRGDQRIFYQT